MDDRTTACPKCGAQIGLNDAIIMPLREELRKELREEEKNKAERQLTNNSNVDPRYSERESRLVDRSRHP